MLAKEKYYSRGGQLVSFFFFKNYRLFGAGACSALLLYPYATAITANLSLLLMFTAIVNVLTLLLFKTTVYPHGERHHDSHAIQRSKS